MLLNLPAATAPALVFAIGDSGETAAILSGDFEFSACSTGLHFDKHPRIL
jgi:hypothetical protein